MRKVVASILHGAYGDIYEQLICLRHFAVTQPEVELKLFFSRQSRLDAFRVLNLSFASVVDIWTEIEKHANIETFFQFQVRDEELNTEVLEKLPDAILAKFDRDYNRLPWDYMRRNHLMPVPECCKLKLSQHGEEQLETLCGDYGISDGTWRQPTVSFLWRYRHPQENAISKFGQKSQSDLVRRYSSIFQRLIREFDCRILVCGMNIVTTDSNRDLTDNKYPSFGLDLPPDRVIYMQGKSWPVELEIASRATVCCGNASGFTEALWLKRGKDTVIMDPPPHYVAKAVYHRMPFRTLIDPVFAVAALLGLPSPPYFGRLKRALKARL